MLFVKNVLDFVLLRNRISSNVQTKQNNEHKITKSFWLKLYSDKMLNKI